MERIREERLAKLKKIQEEGYPLYPNDFKPDSLAEELKQRYGGMTDQELEGLEGEFSLAGRVVLMRVFGRALFINLQDVSGRIQCYLREDVLGRKDYRFFRKNVDIGDIVGVYGKLFRTKTGELTILVKGFKLLVKSLRPLPEKWHGLTDVELRYRQRYLDLISNRDALERFKARTLIIRSIRKFFDDRGFYEVETPMMHLVAGGAAAKPFKTHHNALDLDLYLRIAPELYLKRLLVGGFDRIYELGRNFRNEGISSHHNPEFTMIEFYQAYATYEDLIQLTEELFSHLVDRFPQFRKVKRDGRSLDLSPPFKRLDMQEALVMYAGLKESQLDNEDDLRAASVEMGLDSDEASLMTKGELATWIFEEKVEDTLFEPTFVLGYPKEVSPLARYNDENPSLVDRFELFIGGMEVANGFSELNDPIEQRRRFQDQVEKARARGEEKDMDEDFIVALEHGMPPAAGEGIGIDRLVMILTGASSIRDVILFPLLRPHRD